MINKRYRNSVKNAKARPGADCGSDHNPVVINIKTTLKRMKKNKCTRRKWNVSKLESGTIKEKYKIESEKLIDAKDHGENVEEAWGKLKGCLIKTADIVCGKRMHSKKQSWITEEILDKMEERRMWKRNEEKYKSLSKTVKKMCRKAKNDYYNKICNEIESLDRTHNPKLYQKVKQLRPRKLQSVEGVKNKDGKVLFEEKDILERWVEYIGELYSDDRPDICTDTNIIYNTVNISEMEVREIISKLPKGKSTGIDEIPAEFLQSMGIKGIEMMTWIINKCYNTGFQPEDFLKSIFIQLPKVKNTKECAEHRTISLISHAAKILLHIIKRRITPLAEKNMSENQLGFREGRGTRDAICQTRLLAERMISKNRKIFACFIDYKKAFDKVNHSKLIQVLRKYDVPAEEIRLILHLYWSQTAQIRGRSEDSQSFKIEKGVRQGCVLSPVFFNMYSEELINEALQNEAGLVVNGMAINNIRFADDTVLLAGTEEELQRQLDKVNESCTAFGMELNAKKTKVMVMEKQPGTEVTIKLNGIALEQVNKYKYLGTLITADSRCIQEIKRRIGIAKRSFWELKELMKSNVNMKTKKRLLNTYIFSLLTYGCEAWTIGREAARRINAFEIWCYRRILKISWINRTTNKEVFDRIKEKPTLLKKIAKRKSSFFGHIVRSSSRNLFVNILEGFIDGKKSKGRPRRMWIDDIKEWANVREYGQLKRKAQCREQWRSMIGNLRTLEDAT